MYDGSVSRALIMVKPICLAGRDHTALDYCSPAGCMCSAFKLKARAKLPYISSWHIYVHPRDLCMVIMITDPDMVFEAFCLSWATNKSISHTGTHTRTLQFASLHFVHCVFGPSFLQQWMKLVKHIKKFPDVGIGDEMSDITFKT